MGIATHTDVFSRSPIPFLDRSRTIAKPGYSRWMVPPAALCVHLCIGQAYAFSVFNLPMTRLLGTSIGRVVDEPLAPAYKAGYFGEPIRSPEQLAEPPGKSREQPLAIQAGSRRDRG